MEGKALLSVKHITKAYPGVVALDDVSLDLYKGETLALMGENGAGKSTFIKALAGAIRPDAGKICIDGTEYTEITPALAKTLGIEVIYQEFNLMPTLTVAENIFMGNFPKQNGLVSKKEMVKCAYALFERMGVDIDPLKLVSDLSVGYMQLVEIAKALSKNVRILIMDEPTAPLTDGEIEILFQMVDQLHKDGVSIIYISHRLNEIFRISNRVTVLRDGKKIGTYDTKTMTRESLIKSMVGREMNETYPERKNKLGEVLLRVDKLCGNGVKDVTFELHKGEILGFGGLVGAGRTEIMRVLFGADMRDSGKVFLDGREIHSKSPAQSIKEGIVLVPEDRKQQGVVLGLTIAENISLPNLAAVSTVSVINSNKERKMIQEQVDALKIATPSIHQKVKNLSGGNQQKVVLGKWMAGKSKVLIFDEPTRGIDVGAKHEIYNLMNALCERGLSIIMVSSDMEELLGMSDRIVVLCEGEQTGIIERSEFSQEATLTLASGKS